MLLQRASLRLSAPAFSCRLPPTTALPLRIASVRNSSSLPARPRRSLLYVPCSSSKKLAGALSPSSSSSAPDSRADTLILDLEDSVAPAQKADAREALVAALRGRERGAQEVAVRINAPSEGFEEGGLAWRDAEAALGCEAVEALVLPKVESASDIHSILSLSSSLRGTPPSLILSIESARSLLSMPSILSSLAAQYGSLQQAGVESLLFASEDYCAATGIERTKGRTELLFPRAQIVTIAKAFGLGAIDMVCVDYKDATNLAAEAREARQLGMTGKQAIHPAQVAHINACFLPSPKDIARAAKIRKAYLDSVERKAGAVGMEEEGSMVMIDAPMLKQADATLAKARAAGLAIPDV